jgi:hypothetical protein
LSSQARTLRLVRGNRFKYHYEILGAGSWEWARRNTARLMLVGLGELLE